MSDNSEQALKIEDQTAFIIASSDARKVVRMIDVLNDLDMEKLATFRGENKAQRFETTVAQFDSEEDAGERYDEITSRYANLPVTTPVNEFDPRHPGSLIADMDQLIEICTRLDICLIEDCAHTLGGKWRGIKSGNFGNAAALSP